MLRKQLNNIIYPGGIPNEKYLRYMGWSFVSTMAVSVQTAMSTHSMLDAIGTDSNRTSNYIGKDIIGQLGGLVYMSKMGVKGDENPRQFMMYSNIMQQASILGICSTPMFDESYFLPIAGLSNTMSNISFAGYGAINAKCIQKLSSDNICELYAKITMTNTLASTFGLTIGVMICSYMPDHQSRMLLLPVIGYIRIYSYERAIRDLI